MNLDGVLIHEIAWMAFIEINEIHHHGLIQLIDATTLRPTFFCTYIKDLIMKSLLTTLISVIAIGATFPAFAGPDWQVIEHGRKVKLERMRQAAAAEGAETPTPAGKAPDAAQPMDTALNAIGG